MLGVGGRGERCRRSNPTPRGRTLLLIMQFNIGALTPCTGRLHSSPCTRTELHYPSSYPRLYCTSTYPPTTVLCLRAYPQQALTLQAGALGPRHSLERLDTILGGELLVQWRERAAQLKEKGW